MIPVTPLPLVALDEFTEEVRTGYGDASLAVRTLDRVTLTIHTDELLVVHGGVASGAASLIAAIVGRRVGAATVRRGGCHVDTSVQIRRARIDGDALRALVHAWTAYSRDASYRITPRVADAGRTARPLYVLRVGASTRCAIHATRSREGPSAWRSWVEAVRQCGGSVLVHTTTALDVLLTQHAAPHVVREALSASDSLRVLRCEAGRVTSAADRKSADASLTASDPYPRASPES